MALMMRRAFLFTLPLFTPVLAAALAGCQTSQATAISSSGDMSPADLEFVTSASSIIRFDRDECGLAQTQATSPLVRAIAAKLLADANGFDAELQPIAAQAGIRPATVLPSPLRIRAARLRLGQGAGFDQAFLADQIASHQDALNLQEDVVATPGRDPRLTELSKRGARLVQSNLQRLQALQQRLVLPLDDDGRRARSRPTRSA